MDAWCALWFWPLTDQTLTVRTDSGPRRIAPPTLVEWIAGLQGLVGRSPEARSRKPSLNNQSLSSAAAWDDLGIAEAAEMGLSAAEPVEQVLRRHPWLVVCDRVAEQQGFFHWNLEFVPVFARRGGFDLQVGNPPWVRPRSDVDALLAEGDPWWQLEVKPSEARRSKKREETLSSRRIADLVVDGTTDVASTAEFIGSVPQYPHLQELQPDSYRCFMEQAWRHASVGGHIGLIHPESHFTDEKAGFLREAAYLRLRRHWQFINELILFEIDHKQWFGIHIYGRTQDSPCFLNATALYHPDTVERSLIHDGTGQEPGFKDPEGNWDLRPHKSRIITAADDTLATWHAVLEGADVPIRRSRMVYAVNRSVAAVLDKLSRAPRIGELRLQFSPGWHEKNDRTKGFFESSWGEPDSWNDVILQGPHLFVATPMYKTPNKTMLHNQDWSATDFETLAPDAIPVTAYKPAGDRAKYDAAYTHWTAADGSSTSPREHYRIAWRRMAANTGERTLIPAIIPPGAAHVNAVFSVASSMESILAIAGFTSSLILDAAVRAVPKGDIYLGSFERLPFLQDHPLTPALELRALRLNCLTDSYSDLWRASWRNEFTDDSWTRDDSQKSLTSLGYAPSPWSADSPLRLAVDRRRALVEIDALVALMLDVTADELCTIYRTQFAVLYGYDHNVYFYDANGRLVPNSVLTVWRKKGDRISKEERTATNQAGNTYTYELPFVTLDREADMRQAYAEFERRLAQRPSPEHSRHSETDTLRQGETSA